MLQAQGALGLVVLPFPAWILGEERRLYLGAGQVIVYPPRRGLPWSSRFTPHTNDPAKDP